MRYRLIHIIILCLTPLYIYGQDIFSQRVSPVGGLSNYFVINLAIDGDGYVWVATESGLNRITGKWSNTIPTTENGSGQHISTLHHHAASGLMLIGLEDGLCAYDYKHGKMIRLGESDGLINYSIDDIAAANDGGVWLIYGNGRVQHFNCNTLKAKEQKLNDYHGNRCGMDDGMGHLYIGYAQQGMGILNLADGNMTTFTHRSGDETSLPGNNVRCIFKDNHGRIWVGTDHGLALFHPEDGVFTKVTRQADDYDDNVYDIKQMDDGTLWVATDMGGVKVINLQDIKSGERLHYSPIHVQTSSINVRSIVQDEFGNIWLGNHSTGVDFISALKSPFKVFTSETNNNHANIPPIYAIAKDGNGGFWLGCEDELSLWKDNHLITQWPIQSMARREHSFPRCLMVDKDGFVWLGMEDEGIIRFNPHDGRFQRINIGHEASDIHSFAQDFTGRIWIGTEFGVYTYANGKVTEEYYITKITHHAPVTGFLWLSSEDILVSTLGMGAFTINTRTRKSISLRTSNGLPSDKINQMIADHEQGVWLATTEGLVHIADPMNMKGITIFGQRNGLANNHIRALQQDNSKRIWVSTFSGISCMNKQEGRFHNYDYFDDKHLNGFASGAAVTTDDGSIYFGSSSGLCVFNPKNFNDAPRMSDVQIVTCEAYNPVGSDTQIQQLIPDKNGRVHTSYKQNTLRLAFTVCNSAQIGHEEYSYMMKGMDNKWYYINGDQDVVFRGLRPGHYTFVLRSKLKSQNWEDASVTQMDIIISPPFWRTWWAYMLYALIIMLWAWYALRSYKRKLALRSSLEIERRENLQKQELNEERLRFFTNITHELRTPLTLILGPLYDLAEDLNLPQQYRHRVSLIQKNAEHLRSLINELLEFRKTETQNRRLTVAKGNIGQFVREICLNYKELYLNPQVQFHYDIDEQTPDIYFDSEVITTILNNFLSNAIKYTERGSITTMVRKEKQTIEISVTDTGYGIAKDALPHIFERYYQAEGSHQASGTGIGLALVKALANLHEARISVQSEEGKGSCFTLSLDINNTYPTALHKEDNRPQSLPKEKDLESVASPITDESDETIEDIPTLLIVEDNADIREYIADSFAEDFHILQAENGEVGLQMAQQHIPDIIVSDIMMPQMNGIQLTRQLKDDIRTSHIPIILLTAKTTDEDKEEGYESGADSYLTKPFTAKLLAKRIQNLLTARRRLAELITARKEDTREQPTSNSLSSLDSSLTSKLSSLDCKFLEKLNGIINDNIMSQNIDMPFLTDHMAMSHSTFYRKVKALTGMTAKEYVRKLQLQHCYQLLESGEYNVNEAAMMTGFNHMAHFREVFKNEFGILPSEVKRK